MPPDRVTLEQLVSSLPPSVAQELLNIGTPDRTEADFRREVARLLLSSPKEIRQSKRPVCVEWPIGRRRRVIRLAARAGWK